VVNPANGVPAAVTVTSSAASATFVAANGLVTVTDAAAAFVAESVGRSMVIAGANSAANNGTYPIVQFIGATQVVIRNPAGVSDAVAAGTMNEVAHLSRWTQLNGSPYLGNVVGQLNGTAIVRMVGV